MPGFETKMTMNKHDKNRPKVERIGAAQLGADKTRILILGGGFAGVEAARYLDRTVAKRSDVEVTLVSRENFSLFTPMLHEVVAAILSRATSAILCANSCVASQS